MAMQKNISKKDVRNMVREPKPFRQRIKNENTNEKLRVEYVWQDDVMVPVAVRRGK